MSKFLTPPVWYDKNGSEINIFDNTTYDSIMKNTAIGTSAIAGSPNGYGAVAVGSQAHAKGNDSIAVGSQAHAEELNSIAIGSYDEMGGSSRDVEALATGSIAIGAGAKANADSTDGIAIGRGATSGQGGIAIGAGADAIADQIQIGNNNTAYTLNIGNGTGTSKIGALNFNEVTSTDIQSNGLYLCTATKTQSGAGVTTTFGFNAFLWIETSRSTTASAADGSATFTYSKPEGQSDWAIRVSGADSNTLKCYRVFSL